MAWASAGNTLDQGSIVSGVNWNNGEHDPLGIVLTNTCDFAHDKASFILIAALVEASAVFKLSRQYKQIVGEEAAQLSKGKSDKLKGHLEEYIHNVGVTRYYFIDPTPAFESPLLLVDFQNLTTINWDEREILNVEGTLNSPFREQCVTRFSAYTSRIGVDRVDNARLQAIVMEIAKPLNLTF